MGIDSIWVCWTCNSYCYPGYDDVLSKKFKDKINYGGNRIKVVEGVIRELGKLSEMFDGYYTSFSYVGRFLSDLLNWLNRHKGHRIFITNDLIWETREPYEFKWRERVDGTKIKVEKPEEF